MTPIMPPLVITSATRLLGVAGWPVEHSLSPVFQNAALRAAGLDYAYLAFGVPPERFEPAVRGLAALGAVGLNCTVPHKNAALALCDELSEEARLVGAANTLQFRADGSIYGTNTDVEGFRETLRHEGHFDLAGRTVVQFGAGGAGRALALAALRSEAASLVLINRTPEKAETLAADLMELYPDAQIMILSLLDDPVETTAVLAEADLVVNATSLGLRESDPFPCAAAFLPPRSLVFDAAYTRQGPTAWLRAAAEVGCRTLDGLGMLVRQGAASFRLWTGVEPDLDAMFAAVTSHAEA